MNSTTTELKMNSTQSKNKSYQEKLVEDTQKLLKNSVPLTEEEKKRLDKSINATGRAFAYDVGLVRTEDITKEQIDKRVSNYTNDRATFCVSIKADGSIDEVRVGTNKQWVAREINGKAKNLEKIMKIKMRLQKKLVDRGVKVIPERINPKLTL